MKKEKGRITKFISSNILGIIIGGVVFGTTTGVIAASVASSDVSYNNSVSGSTATNVKTALDELYTKSTTCASYTSSSVGTSLRISGYNWHVYGEDANNIYLLLDLGELPQLSLCDNDSTSSYYCGQYTISDTSTRTDYSWYASRIRAYLNGPNFLTGLDSSIQSKIVATEICKDPTSVSPYGGWTKAEITSVGATCTRGYASDKIRLMTVSEFINLSPGYTNETWPVSGNSLATYTFMDIANIPKVSYIQRISLSEANSWIKGDTGSNWYIMSNGVRTRSSAHSVSYSSITINEANPIYNYYMRPVMILKK